MGLGYTKNSNGASDFIAKDKIWFNNVPVKGTNETDFTPDYEDGETSWKDDQGFRYSFDAVSGHIRVVFKNGKKMDYSHINSDTNPSRHKY
jgi:hypothetical protein